MPEPTKFSDKEKENWESVLFFACPHLEYEHTLNVSSVVIDIVCSF